MSLVEFLRARLAEDLDAAVRAVPGPWQVDPDNPERVRGLAPLPGPEADDDVAWLGSWEVRATGRHIARHDPARIVVQVGAMRRIVDLHDGEHECMAFGGGGTWLDGSYDDCATLRLLALPYAGHPDYRQEWREHTGGTA